MGSARKFPPRAGSPAPEGGFHAHGPDAAKRALTSPQALCFNPARSSPPSPVGSFLRPVVPQVGGAAPPRAPCSVLSAARRRASSAAAVEPHRAQRQGDACRIATTACLWTAAALTASARHLCCQSVGPFSWVNCESDVARSRRPRHATCVTRTSGTIRFSMRKSLIAISNSAIICSEGLIVALLGTISLRTRFQEIISRKSRLRRCHLGIDTLTRGRPGNIPMCKHHF